MGKLRRAVRWDLLVSNVKHRGIHSSGRRAHLDGTVKFHISSRGCSHGAERRRPGTPPSPARGGDAIAAAPRTGPRRISCLRSPSIPGNDLSRGQEGRALDRRQPRSPVRSAATPGPSGHGSARSSPPAPQSAERARAAVTAAGSTARRGALT